MEKPNVKTCKHIDIFDMLDWCDQCKAGLKDRVWGYLVDDIIANDISMYLDFDVKNCADMGLELKEDFALITAHFPEVLEDGFLFDICW